MLRDIIQEVTQPKHSSSKFCRPLKPGKKAYNFQVQTGQQSTASPPENERPTTANHHVDPELEFEERFGNIMAERDNLAREKDGMEKEMKELHNRLVRLQDNNQSLQDQLAEAEDTLNGAKKNNTDLSESRFRQQAELIASQEVRISEQQTITENLQRSIESYKARAEKTQELKDTLDEYKKENETLAKKANTLERYKQKLQSSQTLEKDNRDLQNEVEELKQQISGLEAEKSRLSGAQLAAEEYRRIVPRIEQDMHENNLLKKQLEFDNKALSERWRKANEQLAQDQETIADLQDKVREYENLHTSPKRESSDLGTLERELADGETTQDRL